VAGTSPESRPENKYKAEQGITGTADQIKKGAEGKTS